MSIDIQEISLDVSKQPDVQAVRLGQGDANGTQLVVNVFDDGVPKDLSEYDVRLSIQLPNKGGWYAVDGTRSGNVATFDIDETYAAAVAGENGFGYVDVIDGDEIICSTGRFQLVVLRSAQDGVDPATAYSNEIEELIERVYEALEAMGDISELAVPLMSADIRGGAKLGSGLTLTDGALSLGLHVHSASDITSGTLGASRGGTGVTTASAERDRLGLGNTTGALPIANGGTGSTTADDARAAIGASRCWYATCSTAAATAAKEASCTGFVLETGTMVAVRFSNSNSAASATLNVNSTGAKAIYANASTTAANVTWAAGETVTLVYDGTYWRMTNSVGLNALRESVSRIISGFKSATVTPNAVTKTHVAFPSGLFSSAPNVFVSLGSSSEYSSSAHLHLAAVSLVAANIATTGFDIQLGYAGTTTQETAGVEWIAVG